MVLVLSEPYPHPTESVGAPPAGLPSSLVTATRVSGCQGPWSMLVSSSPSCLSAAVVRWGLLSLGHGSFGGSLVIGALSHWDPGEEVLHA